MHNEYQQTLAKPITFNGFGIHSGKFSEVTLAPLKENQGLIFRSEGFAVPYKSENVRGDARGTQVIVSESISIMTVEHLVSALAGMGIDNVLIEVEGPEVPIKDGSPKFFVEQILKAGIKKQESPKKYFNLKEKKILIDKDKAILALPAENFKVNFLIDYSDNLTKTDYAVFTADKNNYLEDLALARTYGFTHEVEALLASGKALGATLQNAIVVGENGYSLPLNYPNELARHKIVDFIGDIMALGALPKAEFWVIKSGHALNQKFVRLVVS